MASRLSQRLLPLLALLGLWPARAAASESFPPIVMVEYDLESAPECTLCHETDEGGSGTATKPLAVTLIRYGAAGKNNGSMSAALQTVMRERSDSDGDCYADYDELVAGLDPNDPSDGPEGCMSDFEIYSGPLPQHGCAVARMSTTSASSDGPMPVVFAFLAVILGVSAMRIGSRSRNRRALSDSRTSCGALRKTESGTAGVNSGNPTVY